MHCSAAVGIMQCYREIAVWSRATPNFITGMHGSPAMQNVDLSANSIQHVYRYRTSMHLMKERVTEVEEAHLKVTLSYVHKLG